MATSSDINNARELIGYLSELGLALRKSIGRAILVAQSAAPSVVRAARSAEF
jgi:hypothetical protein